MASSSHSSKTGGESVDVRYAYRSCNCGRKADLRIVDSEKASKGQLYWVCEKRPHGCEFWAWCKPISFKCLGREQTVEESPRVVAPRFVFDEDQVMLRLMKLEGNMDGMMVMTKWSFWVTVFALFCTILVLMVK
ncbi:hypothetical protein RHMOL_Rhmol02G0040200 [Rhododendron molle]|uniref:Uncharacterized protein n=2 Tax=Rhododendron molle TaxID=49168 RepID=A0ACC0LE36_RHOML|nr:hypothetical protein RHMOL_Rhmol12G0008900 [Rhododendron molle]KAI8566435.1 hypothetical protein RHMOL_Rhmol02G0040200 [Rhododendron molle]